MRVLVETTRFVDDNQIDLNYLHLQMFDKPLVVASRDGQIYRVNEWTKAHKISIKVIGWWDLWFEEYVKQPVIALPKFFEHDGVIFLDPTRAGQKDMYNKIIDNVKKM